MSKRRKYVDEIAIKQINAQTDTLNKKAEILNKQLLEIEKQIEKNIKKAD